MVAIFNGEGESSCILEKIELVVFKSSLQRSKSVIFEGFVRRHSDGKEEEDEEEKVESFLRKREF